MRAYTCSFMGKYLGGYAVVVARGRERAFDLMALKLLEIGLGDKNCNDFTKDSLHPLPIKCTGKEYIKILFDGDY